MELIDKKMLRDSLMHEQAKYMMSEHQQNKHTSAGFLLAVAELDSQPTVKAIPIDWVKKYTAVWHHTNIETVLNNMLSEWEKQERDK